MTAQLIFPQFPGTAPIWPKRWNTYYRFIAMSEMVSHQFLSPDYSIQQTTFANGVAAKFNMAISKFFVKNIPDFSEE